MGFSCLYPAVTFPGQSLGSNLNFDDFVKSDLQQHFHFQLPKRVLKLSTQVPTLLRGLTWRAVRVCSCDGRVF